MKGCFEDIFEASVVQHVAMRLLSRVSHFRRKTLVMCQLYWLTICFQAQVKVLFIIFKALYTLRHLYLSVMGSDSSDEDAVVVEEQKQSVPGPQDSNKKRNSRNSCQSRQRDFCH